MSSSSFPPPKSDNTTISELIKATEDIAPSRNLSIHRPPGKSSNELLNKLTTYITNPRRFTTVTMYPIPLKPLLSPISYSTSSPAIDQSDSAFSPNPISRKIHSSPKPTTCSFQNHPFSRSTAGCQEIVSLCSVPGLMHRTKQDREVGPFRNVHDYEKVGVVGVDRRGSS